MAGSPPIDSGLLEYATPRQVRSLEALIKYGSSTAAAEALGVPETTIRSHLSRTRARAARKGYAPEHDMTKVVPEGFHVRGTSTYYGKDGEKKGQWVKSQIDQESRIELLMRAFEGFAEPFAARSTPVTAPDVSDADLLAVYPLGDPHLGMYAWAEETGNDFDLEIAEQQLTAAVDNLVDIAPNATQALIANLGDFFHSDTQDNRTARAGNPLDVDTRWQKVLRVGVRAFRRLIDRALEKHERVNVVCEIGNHDDHSAAMLALVLKEFYSNNPRVFIDDSPDTFHWLRFGKNLIGVTHGHRVKARDLPGIMACDRKEDWGETEHRYWYTGHVHHDTVKEYPGAIVETFRTLASSDAWHHHSGYRSGRDMKCDVLHREYGRICRHIVGIQQIWPSKGKK